MQSGSGERETQSWVSVAQKNRAESWVSLIQKNRAESIKRKEGGEHPEIK